MARTVRKNSRRRSRQTKRKNQRGGISIKSFGAPWRGIKRSLRKLKQNRKYNDDDKKIMTDKFDELEEVECFKEYLGDKLFRKYKSIKKYQDEGGKFTEGRKIKFIEDYLSGKKGVPDLTEEKKEKLLETFDKLEDVEDLKRKLGDDLHREYEKLKAAKGGDIECKKAIFIEKLPKEILKIDDVVYQIQCPAQSTRVSGSDKCECNEGYEEIVSGDGKLERCVPKSEGDACRKKKYKDEIEELENEIKEETSKLKKHFDSKASKVEQELDSKLKKMTTFIDETKNNMKEMWKKSRIERKKKELRELLTKSAMDCLKQEITSGLSKKIKNEEKLFEEFEELEIRKLKEDFETLFKLKRRPEDKDEIRELSIFVISSHDGNINRNKSTGIESINESHLKANARYKTLEKAYIRLENGKMVDKKFFLPPGTVIEVDSRQQNKTKGTMVQIVSVISTEGQSSYDEYDAGWIKLINKKGNQVLKPVHVEDRVALDRDFSERTDANYELKAGDILIMSEPDKVERGGLKFKKKEPAYGDKYYVYLTGTKANPIYIKSQLGGGS